MTGLFCKSTADLSECGKYRYSLERQWDETLPAVVFVMLNPSTADAEVDDPTIRRSLAFAEAWGMGGILVVNLFAFRSAYPRDLLSQSDPIGPRNDAAIRSAIQDKMVVAAWGACEKYAGNRIDDVLAMMEGADLRCLGKTKSGQPRHPLYVHSSCPPTPISEVP